MTGGENGRYEQGSCCHQRPNSGPKPLEYWRVEDPLAVSDDVADVSVETMVALTAPLMRWVRPKRNGLKD